MKIFEHILRKNESIAEPVYRQDCEEYIESIKDDYNEEQY